MKSEITDENSIIKKTNKNCFKSDEIKESFLKPV